MLSFDINFFPRPETRGTEVGSFDNQLEWWLAGLYRNGNILNRWQILKLDDRTQVRVVGVAPDSLEKLHWDTWTVNEWGKLELSFLTPAQFKQIGEMRAPPTWCECKSP